MVIDPGGDESLGRPDLAAASRAERKRRGTSAEPVAVINDQNLAEYAVGELTFVEEKDLATDLATTDALARSTQEEESWRSGALDRRIRWKAAVDTILETEARAQELRNDFYREDDPHRRDRLIKPEWDRTLEQLAEAKSRAAEAESELLRFIADGLAAGALPGWLREGTELEPTVRPYGEPDEGSPPVGEPTRASSAVGEPTIVPEGGGV